MHVNCKRIRFFQFADRTTLKFTFWTVIKMRYSNAFSRPLDKAIQKRKSEENAPFKHFVFAIIKPYNVEKNWIKSKTKKQTKQILWIFLLCNNCSKSITELNVNYSDRIGIFLCFVDYFLFKKRKTNKYHIELCRYVNWWPESVQVLVKCGVCENGRDLNSFSRHKIQFTRDFGELFWKIFPFISD